MHIEEGDATIAFIFACEFDTGINFIQNFVEGLKGVFEVVTAAKARASGCLASHDAPAVIHVDFEMTGENRVPLFRERVGFGHCVNHPVLRDGHHQRETYWATVFRRVVTIVIDEVSLF